MKKLRSIDELAEICESHKKMGLVVGLCHGTFDLLHIGHLRHFKEARSKVDTLIVTVTADRFVHKGPGRPIFHESFRMEFLDAIEDVDYVGISASESSTHLLRAVKPSIYFKGSDYIRVADDPTGNIITEMEVVQENGGQVHFTDQIVFSSSKIINQNFNVFDETTADYINKIKNAYDFDETCGLLDTFNNIRVLVVGEVIIDKYDFCSPLGLSSKDPVIVAQKRSTESYAGGAAAVASHLKNLGCDVTLLSIFDQESEANRSSKIDPAIRKIGVQGPGLGPITKTRYIDVASNSRLFELYDRPDLVLSDSSRGQLNGLIRDLSSEVDLVLVADYGHGLIDETTVAVINEVATYKFVAANTQANAGNRGYNVCTKYDKLQLMCLAEHEYRLATREKRQDLPSLIAENPFDTRYENLIVTAGRRGIFFRDRHYKKTTELIHGPAFAHRIVDRVGAGDSVFAVASLAIYRSFPEDLVCLVGNLVGGMMVETLGNAKSARLDLLKKSLKTIFF